MREGLLPACSSPAGRRLLAAGAHDALSAKLAEEAGFDAIWASGFGISAVQAVPDANILTLTETLDAVRRICDAVDDPGHRRLRQRLRQRHQRDAHGDRVRARRCRGHLHRGQRVPEAVQLLRRRAPRPGGGRGACAQDRGGRARPGAARGLRRHRAHRGADRRPRHRRGPAPRAQAYADAGADAVLVHSKRRTSASSPRSPRGWDASPSPLVAVPDDLPGRRPRRARRRGLPASRSSPTSRCAPRSSPCATSCARMRETRQDRVASSDRHRAARGGLPAGRRPGAQGEREALPLRRAPSRRRPSSWRPASSRSCCRSPRTVPKRHARREGQDASSSARSSRSGASASATSRSCAATRRSRCGVGGRALRRQRPLRARPASSTRCFRAEDELGGPVRRPLRRHRLRAERARAARCARRPTSPSWSIAPSPTRCGPGMPPPPAPLDLVVTETPPDGPSLRRAGGRQPRAAHRARGRARGGARRVHRAGRVLRRRAPQRCATSTPSSSAQRAEGLERASITHILQAMIDRGAPGDRGRDPQGLDGDRQLRRLPARLARGAALSAPVASRPIASSIAPRRRHRLLHRRAVLARRPGHRRARAPRPLPRRDARGRGARRRGGRVPRRQAARSSSCRTPGSASR